MPDPNMTARLLRLVDLLIKRTERGNSSWQSGTKGEPFTLSTTTSTIRLVSDDGDGLRPYEMTVFDQAGIPIEKRQTRRTPYPYQDRPAIEEELDDKIESLYFLVRRNTLNIEDFLNNVAAELEEE